VNMELEVVVVPVSDSRNLIQLAFPAILITVAVNTHMALSRWNQSMLPADSASVLW
jgi:hypothetical protein